MLSKSDSEIGTIARGDRPVLHLAVVEIRPAHRARQGGAGRAHSRRPSLRGDGAARPGRSGGSRHHRSDLVGPAAKISAVARQHGLNIGRFEIVDAPHSGAAAVKAVELVRESKGELFMKGSLHTDELMCKVTSSKTGLRTARRISHVFIMDVPSHAETLFLTHAAINIFPDLDTKLDIVQNVIDCSLRSASARRGSQFFPRSKP